MSYKAKRQARDDTQWSGARKKKKKEKKKNQTVAVDRWMDDKVIERMERRTVRVMPLSCSLRHKTAAGAGWHSNGMKESHFLSGETETERQQHFLLRG